MTTCVMHHSEDLWFDYVEGELDQSFKSDLDLHLVDCPACKQVVADFQQIKMALKSSTALKLPDDAFFASLEGKIMGSLDKTTDSDNVVAMADHWRRRVLIPFSAAAAAVFIIFGALYKIPSFNSSPTGLDQQANLEEQFIIQTASNDPAVFGNMMGHRGSEEMMFNAAAEKLSHMSDREARMMLNSLR